MFTMTSMKRVGTTMKSPGRRSCSLRLHEGPFSDAKLLRELGRLNRYCFNGTINGKRVKNPYEKGLKQLRKIIRRISSHQIESQRPMKVLVHCSVKLLIHFQNAVYKREFLCSWRGRRQYRTATNCYLDLLKLLVTNNESELVSTVVEVIKEENLFGYQVLSSDLLNALIMAIEIPGATVVNELWNKIEEPETSFDDSRAIVRSLYEIMDFYDWPLAEETLITLERLLRIYRSSIGKELKTDSHEKSTYKLLRKGLKVCLQRTIEHLANNHILVVIRHMCSWTVDKSIVDEDVLDFGSSLEYAAFKYESKLFEDTLSPEIFTLITQMIRSQSRLVSLLGNRVMQFLIDRGDNRNRFETPQLFFEDTNYDLNTSRYQREDKIFLKNNRAELHDSLMAGMLNHCSTRLNLESSYCTICIFAVEIPCGFTAAALVCLAMNLQDQSMEREDIRREVTFHIHASVVAILSLLCWIHGAKAFYQYVNKIIMERARWAPHLNPPIQSHYYFATHHVLWDKPELFFVDWEARYGLWKCFRLLDHS